MAAVLELTPLDFAWRHWQSRRDALEGLDTGHLVDGDCALFFATGTLIGGILGLWLFERLINTSSLESVANAYLGAAAMMVVAAAVQCIWGFGAEGKPVEEVARPLTFTD